MNQGIEAEEESVVEEARPLFPVRGVDHGPPSEAIEVEGVSEALLYATMNPFRSMLEERRGLLKGIEVMKGGACPMFMAELPGEAEGPPMSIDGGGPDS